MTSKTKHYIELSDMIALQLECGRCGATLSLPLKENMDVRALRNCPNCNEGWASLGGSSIEAAITAYADALRKLDAALTGRAELQKDGGVRITLEINAEVVQTKAG